MITPVTHSHKRYKPGQLVTINHRVFRIVKNKSTFSDCDKCDLFSLEQKEWCDYCICNCCMRRCYFKLIKKHKG